MTRSRNQSTAGYTALRDSSPTSDLRSNGKANADSKIPDFRSYFSPRKDGPLISRLLWRLLSPPETPKEPGPSPIARANLFSKWFFSWCFPIILVATARKELHLEDIGLIDPRLEAHRKIDQFNNSLKEHASTQSRIPLIRAIFSTYRREIIVGCIFEMLGNYFELLVSPIVYFFGKHLYQAFHYRGDDMNEEFPIWISIGYVLAIALASFFSRSLRAHSVYQFALVGGRTRTLLSASMYSKAMVVSRTAIRPLAVKATQQTEKEKQAKKENLIGREVPGAHSPAKDNIEADFTWNDGAIFSAMTVDTGRIEAAVAVSNTLWPFATVLPAFLALSWFYMSWPGLLGATLMGLSPLPLGRFGSIISRRRARVNELTRERANLTLGMLKEVRFLKMFAWEDLFLHRFDEKRREETIRIGRLTLDVGLMSALTASFNRYPSLLLNFLYAYFYVGGMSLAYNVMALQALVYSSLDTSGRMTQNAPTVFSSIASFQNVQDFLLAEERESGSTFESTESPNNAIELDNAIFTWNSEQNVTEEESALVADLNPQFTLQPITLSVKRSELIAIVGSVGAGKSSLVSGLVGEMEHVGGRVGFSLDNGLVSYCAQVPWIQNATVQENIVFGQPFDSVRYNRVLRACALDYDLQSPKFADGDMTELGERGITVSGGQKARIQLARTIYRDAPTVILDDPLSAVDAHTARHLFEQAILGELQGTCRLLITHQLQVLNRCDRVVWMQAGRIRAVDTYATLMAKEPEFASFVGEADKYGSDVNATPETTTSPSSELETTEEGPNDGQARIGLMKDEKKEVEAVPWDLYKLLLRMSTSWSYLILIFPLLVVSQIFNMGVSMTVAVWSAGLYNLSDLTYALIMFGCIFGHTLTWVTFYVALQRVCIRTSRTVAHEAFDRVLHAPLSYFDRTPLGQIINRFTLDVEITDSQLPLATWTALLRMTAIASMIGSIAAYVPFSLILFVPWFLIILNILFIYASTPLALRRIEAIRRSFFVTKLEEGLSGRATFTTSGRVPHFQRILYGTIDNLNSINFMQFATAAWIDIASAMVSCLLTICIGLLVAEKRFVLSPSLGLYVLAVCPQVSSYMSNSLGLVERVQRGMNAFQRLLHFRSELPDEGQRIVPDAVGKSWPTDGSISIMNANMRYRPELPLALANLNLHVAHGQKIGVVGRTGAGKSSLLALLLRTVPLESGSTIISGIDTAGIGLHTLRETISVIPQDPSLFLGQLWFNLDPGADPTDPASRARMMAVLRDVGLIDGDHGLSLTLETPVSAGGSEFSTGTRQLIALARALLRNTHIVIIDEATSSVDYESDARVQTTIRTRFADRTIIAIAHRIRTALHYDRICVMDDGGVVEFDTPQALWARNGYFRKLCEASKVTAAELETART